MKIRVLLFARLREMAGREIIELEMEPGGTIGDVWDRLRRSVPALSDFLHPPLSARNQEHVRPGEPVGEGDEIAFFPPVSGG
jgi:molybdopterin converting factor small subunit